MELLECSTCHNPPTCYPSSEKVRKTTVICHHCGSWTHGQTEEKAFLAWNRFQESKMPKSRGRKKSE